MSEFLKVLLNIRSLRAALRELSLDQLKEAHEKIETIYLERLEVAEKEQAAQAEHQQKLAEFIGPMALFVCEERLVGVHDLETAMVTLSQVLPNPAAVDRFKENVRKQLG